ncbi:MAG: helix-turn-helix domain-containing protein [Bacteroidota bacterium]
MADLNKMLQEIRNRTKPEQKRYIKKNIAIVNAIYEALERKNMKASDLARKMGKSPAEISKWLSGSHNLTLQSITKLETIFDEDIVLTPYEAQSQFERTKYVTFRVQANPNRLREISYNQQSAEWSIIGRTQTSKKLVS